MAKSKQEIINEIDAHLAKDSGKYYSDYYVGIASKPKERLFDDHNVPEKNHCWIHREANSHTIAREVENYYLDKGMEGGDGGGSDKSKFVYVYKISVVTDE